VSQSTFELFTPRIKFEKPRLSNAVLYGVSWLISHLRISGFTVKHSFNYFSLDMGQHFTHEITFNKSYDMLFEQPESKQKVLWETNFLSQTFLFTAST
jgi:uncharacterized membrane protein